MVPFSARALKVILLKYMCTNKTKQQYENIFIMILLFPLSISIGMKSNE